jgi:hypothetical protein
MERQPVTSSNLRSVGYDAKQLLLEVEFQDGATYQYTGVPASAHQALMLAGSKGSYFHANIRDRYPYHRVS